MLLQIAYRMLPKNYKHLAKKSLSNFTCFKKINIFLKMKKKSILDQLRWFQLLVIAFVRVRFNEVAASSYFQVSSPNLHW